jgi:hypothetical protein
MAFHLFLDRVYLDKDAQEWIIRKSNLEWVIARPAVLTNGTRTGTYRVLGSRLIKRNLLIRLALFASLPTTWKSEIAGAQRLL